MAVKSKQAGDHYMWAEDDHTNVSGLNTRLQTLQRKSYGGTQGLRTAGMREDKCFAEVCKP